jgi:hypothetical protein
MSSSVVHPKENFQIWTYPNVLDPFGFLSKSTELVYEPKKWLQPFCMTKLFGVLYHHQALQEEHSIVKSPVNYKLYKDYTMPLFQKHTYSCPELL